MPKVIIADTSCLILLEKIEELPLLHQLYNEVCITEEIAHEFGSNLPTWIKIVDASDKKYQKIIEASVDIGEASAIAFAIEQEDCLLIMDDFKGRKFAKQLGINVTGSLGVILHAKQLGIIQSIKNVLEKVNSTNFRLPAELIEQVIKESGE